MSLRATGTALLLLLALAGLATALPASAAQHRSLQQRGSRPSQGNSNGNRPIGNRPSLPPPANDDSQSDSDVDGGNNDANEGGRVTFTTYMDAACTQLPAQDSVVHLDVAVECNTAPKASISNVVCYADRIEYDNHPNNGDCSTSPFQNTLPVGVCTEFPGPVPTWKWIEPSTYDCFSAAAVEDSSNAIASSDDVQSDGADGSADEGGDDGESEVGATATGISRPDRNMTRPSVTEADIIEKLEAAMDEDRLAQLMEKAGVSTMEELMEAILVAMSDRQRGGMMGGGMPGDDTDAIPTRRFARRLAQ